MQARSFPPTYNYRPDGSACRIYGSVEVKKVTGMQLYSFTVLLRETSFVFVNRKPTCTLQRWAMVMQGTNTPTIPASNVCLRPALNDGADLTLRFARDEFKPYHH